MSKPIVKAPKKFTIKSFLYQRIQILQWLPKYTKEDVIADFIAGLTVGLTMMPQSIAYANLAGLPAQYGLYTAFIGSFAYVFFGGIKEVSIGPTSLMALLTISYTEKLNVDYVILLSFLAGIVELLMGVFKLGFLVAFISPCVTSAFTTAMSITIGIAQLKNLLGLRKLNNHGIFDVLTKIYHKFYEIRLNDTLLGCACLIFLYAFKQLPRIPTKNPVWKKTFWLISISRNALVVLLTSTIAFYCKDSFVLSGDVPSGIPRVQLPPFSTQLGNHTVGILEMVQNLGSSIFVIPMAAVLANVAIAKSFAVGVTVDATQEMITLGLCNIFGSFVQAMPSCGAFTRSAVASSSGVRTPLQGIYSGSVILLALSFLTPLFYYIPRTALAAVLITAVSSLADFGIYPKLWKTNHKFEFYLTVITLIAGILYGIEVSFMIGGILNLVILLKAWTRPEIIKEIRLNDDGEQYVYIRPDLGLFYPVMDYFTSQIYDALNATNLMSITLDCSQIVRMDYSCCLMIENLVKTVQKKNKSIMLVNLKPKIYAILDKTIDMQSLKVCYQPLETSEDSNANHESALMHRKLSYYDNV